MTSRAPRLLIGALAAATLVVTLGGATGAWPVGAPAFDYDRAGEVPVSNRSTTSSGPGAARDPAAVESGGDVRDTGPSAAGASGSSAPGAPAARAASIPPPTSAGSGDAGSDAARRQTERLSDPGLPPVPVRSGSGRRVVFDVGDQRVWLVGKRDVRRSYLVSGSRYDNLSPGRYAVYSRSRHATSFTFDETMDYMVRFAQGEQSSIGFHDIPVDASGEPVQTRKQLGRPLSAGCVRQARRDAIALWRFAGIGTDVVVTG